MHVGAGAVVLLVMAACGRVGFTPNPGDALVDGPADGPADGPTDALEDGPALDAPPRPGCAPAETVGPFTSDFAQGVPAWGSIYEIAPAQMDVFEGALRGQPGIAAGSTVYAGLEAPVGDYRARRVFVQVPQMVNVASCAQLSLVIQDDDQEQFAELSQTCGQLEAQLWVGGSSLQVGLRPYDPVAHRWWQLRAEAGTLWFEVSPDGLTWTEFATALTPTYFDDAYLELSAGTYQLETEPPGEGRFDDLFDCLRPTQ